MTLNGFQQVGAPNARHMVVLWSKLEPARQNRLGQMNVFSTHKAQLASSCYLLGLQGFFNLFLIVLPTNNASPTPPKHRSLKKDPAGALTLTTSRLSWPISLGSSLALWSEKWKRNRLLSLSEVCYEGKPKGHHVSSYLDLSLKRVGFLRGSPTNR